MKKVKAMLRLADKKLDTSRSYKAQQLKNMRQEKKAYGGKIDIKKEDTRGALKRGSDSLLQIASLGTINPKPKIKKSYNLEKNKPTTKTEEIKHKVIDKIGAKNYNKLNDNKGKIAAGLGVGVAGAAYAEKKRRDDKKPGAIFKRTARKFIDDYL